MVTSILIMLHEQILIIDVLQYVPIISDVCEVAADTIRTDPLVPSLVLPWHLLLSPCGWYEDQYGKMIRY